MSMTRTFVIVADTARKQCNVINPDLRTSQQERVKVRVDRPSGDPSSVVVESQNGAAIFQDPTGGPSSRLVIDGAPWEREINAGRTTGNFALEVFMMVGGQRIAAGAGGAASSAGSLSGEATILSADASMSSQSLTGDTIGLSDSTSEERASSPRMIII